MFTTKQHGISVRLGVQGLKNAALYCFPVQHENEDCVHHIQDNMGIIYTVLYVEKHFSHYLYGCYL